MHFASPLIQGTLIKRYKRFLADIELTNGEQITAHCPNTGAMTGCAEPGFKVWLSKSDNPKRKYAYTWELSQNHQGDWIGVNTGNANKIVAEALTQAKIPELAQYGDFRQEVKYGQENSRIDFLLSDSDQQHCYLEVKSVTLAEQSVGSFPDAVTLRGQKHLRELMELVNQGQRAALLYLVQHTGIKRLDLHSSIDPKYCQLLQQAYQSGVSILCYSCQITQEKIFLNQRLTFEM